MNITVGGLPGTGTTTLCKELQKRVRLKYVYAGQIFRDEAHRRGMDLAAFGALCESDERVDKALDKEQVALLRAGNVLLEGRLAGWMAHREGIPAFKVWVTCDEEERLRRILERDGGDRKSQGSATRARQESETKRYKAYYGIDLTDLGPYDLILDSTHLYPEELATKVLADYTPATS